jgi:hypothetical protein
VISRTVLANYIFIIIITYKPYSKRERLTAQMPSSLSKMAAVTGEASGIQSKPAKGYCKRGRTKS